MKISDAASAAPSPPTPHPARSLAMVRDWRDRYPPWRRSVVLAGFVGVGLLLVDPLRTSIRDVSGRWFHIAVVAWLLAACMAPLAEFLALRLGAVDWPDRRGFHERPASRLGGVAVFSALAIALAVNGMPDFRTNLLMLCAAAVFGLGIAGDVTNVSPRVRLLVLVGLSLLLVPGGLVLTVFPVDAWWGSAGNTVLTMVWMVGVTTAFRSLDDADGLSPGLGVLTAALLVVIGAGGGQVGVVWIGVAVIGAVLGFLPYHLRRTRPAALSLGKSGSTVLGFILAGLGICVQNTPGHQLTNLAAVALIFGIPIYDLVHTTISRIVRGDVHDIRSWLNYAGRDRLHHRFEALLRSRGLAVFLVLLLAATMGLSALAVMEASLPIAVLLLLEGGLIVAVLTVLEWAGTSRERRDVADPDPRESA